MAGKAVVIATGPVTELTHRILEPVARIIVVPVADEDTLKGLAPQAVGFIVRGDSRLSESVIAAAPFLKVIGRSGTGVDGVDVAAATRHGIPVVITPDAGVDAVAEGVMAMLLALIKRLGELDAIVRGGAWASRDTIEIGDLAGSTLGIVGFGRIGRRVAQLAQAFGMSLVVADPLVDNAQIRDRGAEPADLPELFSRSDHVTLHAPLVAETRGLITRELLRSAGPDATFVNLARGALVSSPDAILEALETGALSGVGLDVFEPEPPDLGHPLFSHERVLLSPHALGLTQGSRQRIFEEMSNGMLAVLRGIRPQAVANPEIYEGVSL